MCIACHGGSGCIKVDCLSVNGLAGRSGGWRTGGSPTMNIGLPKSVRRVVRGVSELI